MLYMMRDTFCQIALPYGVGGGSLSCLVSPAKSTVLLFMWHPDIVGVAHFAMDCFVSLGAVFAQQCLVHEDRYLGSDSCPANFAAG